jgi:small-conductance mechanosensitive channel
MAEQLSLTTQEVTPQVVNTAYRVAQIHLSVLPVPMVIVQLFGDNGERIEVRTDTDTEAQQLLQQLNTANLNVKSLQRRCLEWCASKLPRLAGTVSGTPA